MKFRTTSRIGYKMLKGWNTHKYAEWHWNANQRQTQHRPTKKKMDRPNSIFKMEVLQDRTRSPTSIYVHDDDDDKTHIFKLLSFYLFSPEALVFIPYAANHTAQSQNLLPLHSLNIDHIENVLNESETC
jgi:hypothetical protein